jgi:hypothetical protein
MKRVLAFVLCSIAAIMSIAACGGGGHAAATAGPAGADKLTIVGAGN